MSQSICGTVCEAGALGEPLACGYPADHEGPHAWASLPTFIRCPHCKGTGKVKQFGDFKKVDCLSCGGHGWRLA